MIATFCLVKLKFEALIIRAKVIANFEENFFTAFFIFVLVVFNDKFKRSTPISQAK